MQYPNVFLCMLLVAACGGATDRSDTTPVREPRRLRIPSEISSQTYSRYASRLADLALDDPARPPLRDVLVQFLADSCARHIERGETDSAADAFAEALSLYAPSDLPLGLDPRLVRCAEGVRRLLAPGGDEAHVMAALEVLRVLHPTDAAVVEELEQIRHWGEEARQTLPTEAERFGDLVPVYENLVEMLPLPDLVAKLQGLYLERHRSLRRMFSTGQMPAPGTITREQYQTFILALDRTSYDVTRLHLRLGTPQRALGALSSVQGGGETDRRVQGALQTLQDDPEEGYMALAQIFGREHPEAALRSCRAGRLAMPDSPRFPLCLARLLVRTGDLQSSLDAYDDTIQVNPGERQLYEEALEVTTQAMRDLLDDEDLPGARVTYRHARKLMRQHRRAFPDRPIPQERARVDFLMGVGEYQAGNIDRAVQRLEESIEAMPLKDSLVQLGIIAERRSQVAEALRFYRRALDLDLRGPEARLEGYWRATILEHMGDGHALQGDLSRARQLWEEATGAWRQTLANRAARLSGDELASAQLRQGMVLEKLGRAEDAGQAFRGAIDARPDLRQTYEQLLAHYAADGRLREALQVYRRAVNHASIPEQWKIYYALWVVAAQRRAGDASEPAALEFLRDVEGDDWTDRLARFYAGTLPYAQLIGGARTSGERAEAYFYEALNQLAAGHPDQAAELLRQVIATEMMGFFEYDMARRILAALSTGGPAAAVQPSP